MTCNACENVKFSSRRLLKWTALFNASIPTSNPLPTNNYKFYTHTHATCLELPASIVVPGAPGAQVSAPGGLVEGLEGHSGDHNETWGFTSTCIYIYIYTYIHTYIYIYLGLKMSTSKSKKNKHNPPPIRTSQSMHRAFAWNVCRILQDFTVPVPWASCEAQPLFSTACHAEHPWIP